MKKISEQNIFPNFDLYDEYAKIEHLISEKPVIGTFNPFAENFSFLISTSKINPTHTIEQYVNDNDFFDWGIIGTFTAIDNMRKGLGIHKEQFNREVITPELVLNFLQYAVNCIFRFKEIFGIHKNERIIDEALIDVLLGNIKALSNRLGADFSGNDSTGEIFIIYNDNLSNAVVDDYPEIQRSLIEYRKVANSGDLQRKGEILCTLSKRLEADEKKLNSTSYKNLCSDTTFLFDKTGIRHYVEKDKIASETFLKMSPKELELWYDRTYDMFLSCMVISRYLDIKKDIKNIKNCIIPEQEEANP